MVKMKGKPENVSANPLKLIQMILKYKRDGMSIDLGSGEGRNALFLARKGFEVTAVDINPSYIQKISETVRREKLRVNAFVADVSKFQFLKSYDVVLITYVLQWIPDKQALNLIQKMRENTSKNGLNIIVAYTKRGPVHPADKYLPEESELKRLYQDWEILYYKERYVTIQTFEGGRMKKHVAELIARKLRR